MAELKMQKSVDAAILMQQNFNDMQLLFPLNVDWEEWRCCKADIPFSDQVIEYLNVLSVSLLKDTECKKYSDIVTFAFFCRKGNLLRLKEQYLGDEVRLGRGILFHIAPSNVPINFGYSLVIGLLSGNYNIVKVSSKEFRQVDIIVKHLYKISEDQALKKISARIVLVRYDRLSDATTFFSSFCNVRIIWGGDQTITQIRQSSIPARSFDVTFADRYSLAVINADEMVNETNMSNIAQKFYNDTYLFDQNACSAPHLVVWMGNKDHVVCAQAKFWESLSEIVERKYEFHSVMAVDKLTAFYRQAVAMPVWKEQSSTNLLVRVKLESLPKDIDEFRCACGYFSEYIASSFSEIAGIINSKYQTLAYYGYTQGELRNFVKKYSISGIDRIVPIGATTDFSVIWDGYNLINTLSRVCSVI